MADDTKNSGDYYVNVDSYYDKVHRTTWARRTAGFMSGATIGVVCGAAIGLAASFIPAALGALGIAGVAAVGLPALAAIGSSMGLFAGVGGFLGLAINADVSANAASIAAGLEERERRTTYGNHPVKAEGPANLQHEIAEGLNNRHPKLFSWKVAATSALLFAAFGAMIACHPASASLVLDKAFPALTTLSSKIIASTTIFGMFGTTIGIRMSLISNKLSNFYYKLITDQYFNKSPEPVVEKAQTPAPLKAAEQPELQMEQKPEKSFTSTHSRTRFSIKGMIEHHESGTPAPDNSLQR